MTSRLVLRITGGEIGFKRRGWKIFSPQLAGGGRSNFMGGLPRPASPVAPDALAPDRGRSPRTAGVFTGRHLARGLRTIPTKPDQTVSFLVHPGHRPPGALQERPRVSAEPTTAAPGSASPVAAAVPDVRPARLAPEQYAQHFADAAPRLTRSQALVEAERCLYCFDAPCTTACPTGIDVPSFIRRIADDNLRGAATTILDANPLGGTCARVCPTEVLCEQVCVRTVQQGKPVEIGRLQR